jgi:hypothetical protein
LNRLADANAAIALGSLWLATQKNVNAPKDNPSAFVTLSRYQTRLATVTSSMANVTAAGAVRPSGSSGGSVPNRYRRVAQSPQPPALPSSLCTCSANAMKEGEKQPS